MNKRLPLLLTLLALILLAVSIAYWFLQLYRPEQRPLAPPPAVAQAEPSIDAAATLFGGQPAAMTVSNYQLTGVVSAGRDSAVILVADGGPPKAVRIGREIVPGVTVAEVHPRYVMLSEGGVMKRVDLVADTGRPQNGAEMARPEPQPVAAEPVPGVEPQTAPGAVAAPPGMQPGQQVVDPTIEPEPANPNVDPNMAEPNPELERQQNPPPPGQVQMPPPTRSVNGQAPVQPVQQGQAAPVQ